MINEQQILAKIKDGDMHSFNLLVEEYHKQVFNIAYRFFGNTEDAADMTQDAFLKAYKSIKNFRQDSSFKTWIYHITVNVCKDELRKRKRTSFVSLDVPITGDNGQEMDRQLQSEEPSPEEEIESKETRLLVQKIINSLPEDYRSILILREMQDLSYEEISAVLDCSMGTVKSRLNRARKLFKERVLAEREQKLNYNRQVK